MIKKYKVIEHTLDIPHLLLDDIIEMERLDNSSRGRIFSVNGNTDHNACTRCGGVWEVNNEWKEIIEEKKWEVGGYVRIIKDGCYNGIKYKIGDIFSITWASNGTVRVMYNSVILWKDVECEWIGMEPPGGKKGDFKFNIGDRVIMKEGGIQWCNFDNPDNNSIVKTFEDGSAVKIVDRKIKDGVKWYKSDYANSVTEEGLELVENVEVLNKETVDKIKAEYPLTPKECIPPPEEKIEVFPGIYVGDIIVSLVDKSPYRVEGEMLKILPKSKYKLYYKEETFLDIAKDWRKATEKEIEWYNRGITNINIPISGIDRNTVTENTFTGGILENKTTWEEKINIELQKQYKPYLHFNEEKINNRIEEVDYKLRKLNLFQPDGLQIQVGEDIWKWNIPYTKHEDRMQEWLKEEHKNDEIQLIPYIPENYKLITID